MTEYIVRWRMYSDAPNAREAAEDVRSRYFQLKSGAANFEVQAVDDNLKARWEEVNLSVPDGAADRPGWEFTQHALFRMAQKMVEQGDDISAVLEMLEAPWNWSEVLTQVALDDAYDGVSSKPEEVDHSLDSVHSVSE